MPLLLYSPFLSNTINFLFTIGVGLNLVVEVFPRSKDLYFFEEADGALYLTLKDI